MSNKKSVTLLGRVCVVIVIILAFFGVFTVLTTYGKSANKSSTQHSEVYEKYLACYALDPESKKQCTDDLAAQYIDKNLQLDPNYVLSFQFESEKLGFKQFLNNLGLPCDSINDGPEFVEDKQAYMVLCKPNHQYFMQFNYDTKKWSMIEDGK